MAAVSCTRAPFIQRRQHSAERGFEQPLQKAPLLSSRVQGKNLVAIRAWRVPAEKGTELQRGMSRGKRRLRKFTRAVAHAPSL